MNKQELIGKIKSAETLYLSPGPFIGKKLILDLVEQLDEPHKPVVPQFVADWIEDSKKHCKNVVEFFKYKYPNIEMIKWIESEKRFDLVARAWLDGYTVEKEKRYLVKVKGVYLNSCLVFDKGNKKWFFSSIYEIDHQIGHHTRKELEQANFGWVFDCPGIEIEEVEE
nr:MAG TPA: Protein of unknown function (DUF1642) [Caudoviricetes sp.]